MKTVCVIPVYNYLNGAVLISKWIRDVFSKHVEDYRVLIFNDNENNRNTKEFKDINLYGDKFEIFHVKSNTGDLKVPYNMASKKAKQLGFDTVLTIESDCIPREEAIISMIEVYNNSSLNPIASVSTMFKWKGLYCYPTHKHWHTDGLKVKNGRFNINGVGTVASVGQAGVPFLFTLWNIDAISLLGNSGIEEKMMRLDSKFGKYLHEKNFYHLRVIDNYVEHYNGGLKSWSTSSKVNKNKLRIG